MGDRGGGTAPAHHTGSTLMTDAELWDALDGLMAYDVGATDSGIHDEALRARAGAAYVAMDDTARRRFLSDHMEGWASEDIAEMMGWLGGLQREYS